MALAIKVEYRGDLKTFARDQHLRIASGARNAAERLAARAKLAYRGMVRSAGLGDRLANAIRVNIYPASASKRTHAPAVYVSTKAEQVIAAFSEDTTIVPRQGLWLAIPTQNVPRTAKNGRDLAVGKRGTRFQRRASPKDVEDMFGQKLIWIGGGASVKYAVMPLRKLKSGKLKSGMNKSGRLARTAGNVLMFVMVRQVHLSKRLNWDGASRELGEFWRTTFQMEIDRALAA